MTMCGKQAMLSGIIVWLIYLSGAYSTENAVQNTNLTSTEITAETSTVQSVTFETPTTVNDSYINFTTPILETHRTVYFNETDVDTNRNVTIPLNALAIPKDSGLVQSPEHLILNTEEYKSFGLRETAGFVSIGFLAFAVVGYIGFVLWRRYLQDKYNGQTLIAEDVYDMTDLRHFEI